VKGLKTQVQLPGDVDKFKAIFTWLKNDTIA